MKDVYSTEYDALRQKGKPVMVCTSGAALLDREVCAYPMTDDFWIGKDPSQCLLYIPSCSVSSKHCHVFYDASQKCYMAETGSNYGMEVDGRMLFQEDAPVILHHGSVLWLGNKDSFIFLEPLKRKSFFAGKG